MQIKLGQYDLTENPNGFGSMWSYSICENGIEGLEHGPFELYRNDRTGEIVGIEHKPIEVNIRLAINDTPDSDEMLRIGWNTRYAIINRLLQPGQSVKLEVTQGKTTRWVNVRAKEHLYTTWPKDPDIDGAQKPIIELNLIADTPYWLQTHRTQTINYAWQKQHPTAGMVMKNTTGDIPSWPEIEVSKNAAGVNVWDGSNVYVTGNYNNSEKYTIYTDPMNRKVVTASGKRIDQHFEFKSGTLEFPPNYAAKLQLQNNKQSTLTVKDNARYWSAI